MKTPVAILTASRACFPGLPFSVGEQSEYKQDLGKKRNEEGKVRSRFLIAWKEDAMDGQKKGSVWKKTKGRAWAGCWPQQEYLEVYTYKPYWCWLGPRQLRAMLVNTHLTEILEVDQPRAHQSQREIFLIEGLCWCKDQCGGCLGIFWVNWALVVAGKFCS